MEDGINQPTANLLAHLFANGGEMGARIQAFDWAATPIGPIATWPQSLQVALQILLLSKFPMQILWGSDYIQFYNDAYIAIAGDKHPAGLGQRGEDCWHEVWDIVGPMLDQVVATGTATWSEDQLLVLNRRGYPEEGYFTFSYTPIWQSPGNVGGIFIAVNETTQKIVSERRERELRIEMEAAKEVAERANELKDQFLAVLSHELRSPLNPILGWANLLRSREYDASRTQRALETIERNAQVQAQMIDDLLDISRILENKLILDMVPLQLTPIIEDALATVHTAATTKQITIQTGIETDIASVLGDSTRLKQVVWNLLSNAVKFTPDGGYVYIQLNYVDDSAFIQIADTGKGISADFLPYVFDRFQQADSTTTKTFGGLGLGLAIAKQIVDLHGGTIQATSPGDGKGATFTVRLPLLEEQIQAPKSRAAATTEQALENIRILVVEDDDDSRELLTFALQAYGAVVTTVSSARAALERLQEQPPDVLVSDIGMPEMDGYTLMQKIRETPHLKHIPAIALTSYVGEIDQQRAFDVGFQAHLPKPIQIVSLVETIAKLAQN